MLLLGLASSLLGWIHADARVSQRSFQVASVLPVSAFDVVTLAVSPSCVTPWSLQRLNAYFPVRNVHIITKEPASCASFKTLAPNVECHLEDDLLPGLSFHTVQQYLVGRFSDEGDRATAHGRAGWYLQQLTKLGSAIALQGLTDYYLIWDLDMIPLMPFPIFSRPPAAGLDTGSVHNAVAQPLLTRVDISSIQIREYENSYRALFGRPARYPREGMSYVAHWMMVKKDYLLEMLGELSPGGEALTWIWSILDSVRPGYRNIYYGFSEYTTYISWVLDCKPGETLPMEKKTWMRVAPRKHEWLARLHFDQCCPDERVLRAAAKHGWTYLGWELGGAHSAQCKGELRRSGASAMH